MAKRVKDDYATCPFKIIVDTREGAPWFFRGLFADANQNYLPLAVETITRGLKTGDYSIEGFEDEICVERKSLPDLFMSVTSERERFEREFVRMSAMRHAAVVVEGDLEDIELNPPARTKVSGKTVYRTAISWSQRYPGVHWWFCPDRNWAEKMCFQILRMYWESHCKDRVAKVQDAGADDGMVDGRGQLFADEFQF